jgi:hypothetical protein
MKGCWSLGRSCGSLWGCEGDQGAQMVEGKAEALMKGGL